MEVRDISQVAAARREVTQLAGRLGFNEADQGRVALVVTELATNLVKHAGGGIILAAESIPVDTPYIDCASLDKGPGFGDLEKCLADGFSTAGSQGTGMGALLRQSTLLDIYSQPAAGSVVFARLEQGRSPFMRTGVLPKLYQSNSASWAPLWGAVAVPYPGETLCGDGWHVRERTDGLICLVADGLGHGTLAAEASYKAIALFNQHYQGAPADILQRLHAGLRQTRGAAVAIVQVDRDAGLLRVASVGNIGGAVFSQNRMQRLLSHNGTVGHAVRKIQEVTYPATAPLTLVLSSDGIATSWSMDRYPGLLDRHPYTIASVLYRDHQRGTDDATVLVAKS
ncbi:MAG TPA: ATP-binding SpoIIE family protein phosphatase [Dongiaceae bacterium]|nr:ATP-binding SpoIIE family protein phosphatase [Dongiaceae bacterium]